MTTTHLLYLHGFRSSPQSNKARRLAEHVATRHPHVRWWSPQLPPSPREAAALIADGIGSWPRETMAVIGSSLGGYYATWLAERVGCRAVLLNPAIVPLQDLDKHVGVTTQFHSDEPFEFKREYIDELRALAVDPITRPERYFLIAATGDEVLDYRDMVKHYAGARQHVIDGSDHGISEFPDYLDAVLAFCGIGTAR